MTTNTELLAELVEARALREAAEIAFAAADAVGDPTDAIERAMMSAEQLVYELLNECRWREENLKDWRWP